MNKIKLKFKSSRKIWNGRPFLCDGGRKKKKPKESSIFSYNLKFYVYVYTTKTQVPVETKRGYGVP